MIADSTYDTGELVGRPRAGAAAGVAAAALMLAVLAGLDGPNAVRAWLQDAATVVLPASARTPDSLVLAGSFVHITTGGLFGALYAACQQRTSTGGLFVVGGFYGFVLWLGCDLILVRLFHVGPSLLRGWSGLLGIVAFGLMLAAWASLAQQASARLGEQRVGPLD